MEDFENSKKDKKASSILTVAAAEFIERESDRTSMITVTRTEVLDRGKKAMIYVTVLPEEKEEAALSFLKRKRSELHDFLSKKTGLNLIPFVDIIIDRGEKNRQKLQNLH